MSFWKRLRPTPPPAAPSLRSVDDAFVAALESLGFFRLASRETIDAARREILARRYPLAGHVGRQYPMDAEDLAEGGVRDFVGYVAPFLRHEGVQMDVEYGRWKAPPRIAPDPNPYPGPTVRMRLSLERGGELVDVHEESEDGDETRLTLGPRTISFKNDWAEAATQTTALLSALLASHGSPERAWMLYGGGNDGVLVFATSEQVALINSALPDRERLSATAT